LREFGMHECPLCPFEADKARHVAEHFMSFHYDSSRDAAGLYDCPCGRIERRYEMETHLMELLFVGGLAAHFLRGALNLEERR
jgi:hypothetical protein